MGSPTEELRARLEELGVRYTTDDSNDYEIIEWQGPYNLWWQFVYDPYEEEPYGELRLVETGGATHLTPEQAIAATVGKRRSIPSMSKMEGVVCKFLRKIAPDRDWMYLGEVEHAWIAELVNTIATDMIGAVYGIRFAPTFDRPPETMVGETVFDGEGNAIGWIVNATVGAGTCHGEIDSDYFECKLTMFKCHSCGWSGIVDNGYAEYSFDGTDMPRHCPNCGAKVMSE